MLLLKPELRKAWSAHQHVSEVERHWDAQREEYGYSKFSS